jgi:hypothetical protein
MRQSRIPLRLARTTTQFTNGLIRKDARLRAFDSRINVIQRPNPILRIHRSEQVFHLVKHDCLQHCFPFIRETHFPQDAHIIAYFDGTKHKSGYRKIPQIFQQPAGRSPRDRRCCASNAFRLNRCLHFVFLTRSHGDVSLAEPQRTQSPLRPSCVISCFARVLRTGKIFM